MLQQPLAQGGRGSAVRGGRRSAARGTASVEYAASRTRPASCSRSNRWNDRCLEARPAGGFMQPSTAPPSRL